VKTTEATASVASNVATAMLTSELKWLEQCKFCLMIDADWGDI